MRQMVFVKYHDIPIIAMDKFVFRLDTAVFVRPQKVLKRAEYNDRLAFIRLFVLSVNVDFVVVCVFVGNKLPALKIDMRQKVFSPRAFYGGLKRKHKNAL